MKPRRFLKPDLRRGAGVMLLVGILLAGCSSQPGKAGPKLNEQADQVLKGMCEKLAGARAITITARRTIDPALVEGIDVSESTNVVVSVVRPNKFGSVAAGAEHDRRMYYDGKTFSYHDVMPKTYSTVATTGNLGQLFDMMEKRLGIRPPIGQFLRKDSYAALTGRVHISKYNGTVTVGGKNCHHLSFIEELVNWDLWIGVDDQLPCRLTSWSTVLAGKPGLEVDFLHIRLNPDVKAAIFDFTPTADLTRVDMKRSTE